MRAVFLFLAILTCNNVFAVLPAWVGAIPNQTELQEQTIRRVEGHRFCTGIATLSQAFAGKYNLDHEQTTVLFKWICDGNAGQAADQVFAMVPQLDMKNDDDVSVINVAMARLCLEGLIAHYCSGEDSDEKEKDRVCRRASSRVPGGDLDLSTRAVAVVPTRTTAASGGIGFTRGSRGQRGDDGTGYNCEVQ